jgi:CheY-like chemotaxis protein
MPPHRAVLSQMNEPISPIERGRKRGSSSSLESHALRQQRPSIGRRRQSARPRATTTNGHGIEFDRDLAKKHPLTFLVADDNKINRKLLVSMLKKLGYDGVYEAYDGADAVRVMHDVASAGSAKKKAVDVVLMDLWMPLMDGYEATEKILSMQAPVNGHEWKHPTILAVTADVTDGALERAAKVGMKGFMTKPYKLMDLERLIVEYCASEDYFEE